MSAHYPTTYDPVVVSHARAVLASGPRVIAVRGDMRKPENLLADAELTSVIDLTQPTCVIMSAVLHFVDAESARDVTATFIRAIAAGSYLIVSVGSGSRSEQDNFSSAYTAAHVFMHSAHDVSTFFHDLDVLPPGVGPVPCWTGEGGTPDAAVRTATFIGGVARKG